MYKISYTNFNQTGGVNELRQYVGYDNNPGKLQNESFNYNGESFGQLTDRFKFNSLINTVNALKDILLKYKITLDPITSFDLVDTLKDIKAEDEVLITGTADSNYGSYKDKSLEQLVNMNPLNKNDRRKWIKAVLNINRIYLEKIDAAADAAAADAAAAAAAAGAAAVAAPPILTDKEENKLTDEQKEYVREYMVAINEVNKLNINAIMTPQLMDFFHKSGFEVNPMGYDLMKTRPSQTFAESDLLFLLTIGGYKLKSNSSSPIYSRF